MTENEIAKIIVDSAFQIHTNLGPGLLETVYAVVLAHELRKRGLKVEREVPIPINNDGVRFDEGFRADLIGGGFGDCGVVIRGEADSRSWETIAHPASA